MDILNFGKEEITSPSENNNIQNNNTHNQSQNTSADQNEENSPPKPTKWGSSPDRLTQLQEQLRTLSQSFYTSIGVIQRDAEPLKPNEKVSAIQRKDTENQFDLNMMAKEIIDISNFIDTIIQSLPGCTTTEEEQISQMKELEVENQQLADQLRETVRQAEFLLEKVRLALLSLSEIE